MFSFKEGKQYNNLLILIFFLLIALDIFVWHTVISGSAHDALAIYFLDIGQGDSSFINLEGGVQILVDGGPNSRVLERLAEVMKPTDRYIDVVMLTHPQADHLDGLVEVMNRYQVGVFLYNGDASKIGAYGELMRTIKEKNIPTVVVDAKDMITNGDSRMTVWWPPAEFVAKNPNDRSLVIGLKTPALSALFTGDITSKVEKLLRGKGLRAQVLKVPHHGSKYSSSMQLLKLVQPKVSVIESGKNRYGHPTKETLSRLAAVGSRVFRTDTQGTIKVEVSAGAINIFAKKEGIK
ncbi:MAG: hypothetical protein A2939_02685 [Parcubacteria group bacterium RIFCSPLOWO2_01_FULL_48_18]|nr:MAG: hypothetical protein A2939_02685 [Parcubacteria group bacterium RIFCSPLOWO2_01_FULL_48_18]OHB22994.1 MAG: hypothetical protein A3J67_03820 [Parcubacteria group bacterium RIFCSPHIGHO2_02_FULL_48_10b]